MSTASVLSIKDYITILAWACGVVITVSGATTIVLNSLKKIREPEKKQREQVALIADGVQALLRMNIINSCEKYIEKGYCDSDERLTLDKTYSIYSKLGGNDVAKSYKEKALALPTKQQENSYEAG